MRTPPTRQWREARIGDDRVLADDEGDARLLFAIGPPFPVEDPTMRMERALASLEPELTAIRWCEQVHGRIVVSIASEAGCRLERARCVGRCDALITAEQGIGLAVWSADCVPILLVGDGVVAAVHSGWRGTAEDVVGATLRRFEIEYGVPPRRIHATLGPAVSRSRYEVGPEVISALADLGLDEEAWLEGWHVDLKGFLRARLLELGLEPRAIDNIGMCTASSPGLASYRRDGRAAGRQWSLVYRRSPAST